MLAGKLFNILPKGTHAHSVSNGTEEMINPCSQCSHDKPPATAAPKRRPPSLVSHLFSQQTAGPPSLQYIMSYSGLHELKDAAGGPQPYSCNPYG